MCSKGCHGARAAQTQQSLYAVSSWSSSRKGIQTQSQVTSYLEEGNDVENKHQPGKWRKGPPPPFLKHCSGPHVPGLLQEEPAASPCGRDSVQLPISDEQKWESSLTCWLINIATAQVLYLRTCSTTPCLPHIPWTPVTSVCVLSTATAGSPGGVQDEAQRQAQGLQQAGELPSAKIPSKNLLQILDSFGISPEHTAGH